MNSFTISDSTKIKGLAIILMIYHHLFRLVRYSADYNVSFYPFSAERIAEITTFFKICVPIFAFISGYGLMQAYKNHKKDDKSFFIKRYLKLMKIFWPVAIIYYTYTHFVNNLFMPTFFNENIFNGISKLIINFFGFSNIFGLNNYCDNWWYIGTAITFIFILPIIYKLSKKYGWFDVGLGLILIPRIIGITYPNTTNTLPFIFVFYLGMLFQDKNLFKKIDNFRIIKSNRIMNCIIEFILSIVGLFALYFIYINFQRDIVWEFHFSFVPLMIIVFFYKFINRIPAINNILYILGKYSYIIFLIHGIIITNYANIIYLNHHFIVSGIILLTISLIIAIIINSVLKLIERFNLNIKLTK